MKVFKAREVAFLAVGLLLLGLGQLSYWLADGAAPASAPLVRWWAQGLGALWLQIAGVLVIAWPFARRLRGALDGS
ncbi:hypothetical protein [Streptomyces sp. NPDC093225]|uniref:hypothetical protein n=1 Tax=Streptomyces sp. NPDC093225 TaxID=3366034 RepID=UPI003800C11F